MAEWWEALVGPGSQLATWKIIFFFFLPFPIFCWLIVLFLPLCVDLGSFFFGDTTYRGSGPDCVFCSYAMLAFYDRSFHYVLSFIFRAFHVPSPFSHSLCSSLNLGKRWWTPHTRVAPHTRYVLWRDFLSCTLIFDLCVYLTPVVEWSKAQVHPGSIPVTLNINFFFFLLYFDLMLLSGFFGPLRTILASLFFGKRPSKPWTGSLHGRHLGFSTIDRLPFSRRGALMF